MANQNGLELKARAEHVIDTNLDYAVKGATCDSAASITGTCTVCGETVTVYLGDDNDYQISKSDELALGNATGEHSYCYYRLLIETGMFRVNLDMSEDGAEVVGTAFYLSQESIDEFEAMFGAEAGENQIEDESGEYSDFEDMYLVIFTDGDGETHFVLVATATYTWNGTGDTNSTTLYLEW